ncbi:MULTISPECIES: M48 family metalloprotease [Hymenobacter]|uniref:Peptidase M48 n=1 Tax=Hymenobacter jejuensis TaxID=2502781 RepID=A0A5B8A480_9BACT|nr:MULTISPECIES: M48 family metalloprotease [Hymenobacter]MBC6990026.1 M48 family metalloprotease [Hymenobacter sp. BT491]QDA62057.1 peptidase M48 [Hymenobacter jejuensis]
MIRFLSKPWLLLSLAASLATSACSGSGDGVVLFSVDDDKALGTKVAAKTDSTYQASGQLLQRSANPQVYQLLDGVVNRVLNSGQLTYRNEFPWDVKIIKDDNIQNAFATPGGHIYVFTGLIKYLDNESQLAGVLGHEIAHADRRHTSKQLQQQYGISLLLSLVLGENPNQLVTIASELGQLKFSRDFEREADLYSVKYLNGTGYYACNGTAGFFEKAQKEGQTGGTPEFLSTHPDPGSRVEAINTEAQTEGCTGRTVDNTNFDKLKSLL